MAVPRIKPIPVWRVLVPYAAGITASLVREGPWIPAAAFGCMGVLFLVMGMAFLSAFSGRPRGIIPVRPAAALFFLVAGFIAGNLDRREPPHLPVQQPCVISGRVEHAGKDGWVEVRTRWGAFRDTLIPVRMLLPVWLEPGQQPDPPLPGQIRCFTGRLVPIRNNGNPGEVDFASINARKGCWFRMFSDSVSVLPAETVAFGGTWGGWAGIRYRLSEGWVRGTDEEALLKAVCLGDRTGLHPELKASYSKAGGMHILAVSGLHVGLVWWILHRLLSPLAFWTRREWPRAGMILLLLWTFAAITGFSSPVNRSVTMFSLVSLSRLSGRRPQTLSVILCSMLALLCIHPARIADAGFQLSFSAVIAIVLLHPLLTALVRPRLLLLRRVWDATAVSLAAQAGTLPLVILHFHQLPVYSVVTNLFAVPLLSCLVFLFVLSVPFLLSDCGGEIFGRLQQMLAGWMNGGMEGVASLPGSVVEGIPISTAGALLLHALLFTGMVAWRNRDRSFLFPCMWIGSLVLLSGGLHILKESATRTVAIAHFRGGSLVSFREGRTVDHYLWSGDERVVARMERYLESAFPDRRFVQRLNRIERDSAGWHGDHGGALKLCGGASCALTDGSGTWIVGNDRWRGIVVTGPLNGKKAALLASAGTRFILVSGLQTVPRSVWAALARGEADLVVDGSSPGYPRDYPGDSSIHLTTNEGAYLKRDEIRGIRGYFGQ